MSVMKVGGINLEYCMEGSGPPLLLLAGVGSHADTWGEPFLECIRSRFRTIRMSNRGMSETEAWAAGLPIRVMADDAAGLLRELGVEAANVFGYSMGGYIAHEFVLNYPEMVTRLILGCTNCGPAKSIPQSSVDIARVATAMTQAGDDRTRGFCMIMVSEEFAEYRAEFMAEMVDAHRSTPMESFSRQMGAIAAFDSYERLPLIKVSTLLIHGDRDIVIAPANASFLADRIPGAKVQVIPGAGHMFMWERPEETAGIIQEFLCEATVAST